MTGGKFKIRPLALDPGLIGDDPVVVIDVGASGGLQDHWRRLPPAGLRAILFEPDPRAMEELKVRSGGRVQVVNLGLSDAPGRLSLHLCRRQQVSSAYRPNRSFLDRFPDSARFDLFETTEVEVDALDGWLVRNPTEVDFIKIDTEGYELSILKGAQKTLTATIGLLVEVSFAPLRQGQPLFSEVDEFVTRQGFDLFALAPKSWTRKEAAGRNLDSPGQLVFADALYFRGPENVLEMPGVTESKIIRAALVYLVHDYIDLALVLQTLAWEAGLLGQNVAAGLAKTIDQSVRTQRKKTDHQARLRAARYYLNPRTYCRSLLRRVLKAETSER
ncbi:MAG: FkbM family methyltransferase [Deltaproteobacteria bacterium]|nr:FkbM family methyltransferase [Deltaproteobacteria bacterium]